MKYSQQLLDDLAKEFNGNDEIDIYVRQLATSGSPLLSKMLEGARYQSLCMRVIEEIEQHASKKRKLTPDEAQYYIPPIGGKNVN